MKKKMRTICALLATGAVLLAGCGKKYPEAPELLAPKESNESVRPVVVGDLGDITVHFGTVVPTEYCHFYKTNCRIKRILVHVGDNVEAGEILAEADAKDAEETIASLQSKIGMLSSVDSLSDKKFDLEKQRNDLVLAGAKSTGDVKAEAEADAKGKILEENHRYDHMLAGHRIAFASEQLADKQELIETAELTAVHGGIVTYIKDISESDATSNSENVVVIADEKECYLRMDDMTIKDKIDSYEEIYAMSGETKVSLSPIDYSGQERSVADRNKKYPALRMAYDRPTLTPEMGSKVPVYFTKNVVHDVLLVGNDSLYEDAKGSFVYVANETGREKRYVSLGRKDSANSEVTDGLSEGEQVYYSTDIAYPEHYQAVELHAEDYVGEQKTNRYTVESASIVKTASEYTGIVESTYKKKGDPVAVGDLLCVIRTETGNAELTELSTSLRKLEDDYKGRIAAIDKEIAETEQAKRDAELTAQSPVVLPSASPTDAEKASITDAATGTDAEKKDPNLAKELGLSKEILVVDKQIAAVIYDYNHAELAAAFDKANTNNDGTGRFSVYATCDGVIEQNFVDPDNEIREGDAICTIKIPEGQAAMVSFDKKLPVGQKVTFTAEGGKTYQGRISGYMGGSEKDSEIYLTTKGDIAYMTQSVDAGGSKLRHCVTVEDDSIYDVKGMMSVAAVDANFSKVIVLPKKALYTEKDPINESRIMYFVWKVDGDHLVKQYIEKADYEVSAGGSDAFAVAENVIVVVAGLSDGDVVAIEEE